MYLQLSQGFKVPWLQLKQLLSQVGKVGALPQNEGVQIGEVPLVPQLLDVFEVAEDLELQMSEACHGRNSAT